MRPLQSLLAMILALGAEAYSGVQMARPTASQATSSDAVVERLNVAAPPTAEPKAGTPSPLDLWPTEKAQPPRGPSVFKLNQGRAIDVLRRDYPLYFVEKPDFSIFAPEIELHDPSGKRLKGIEQYERVFGMMRFLRRTTMQDAQITHRIVADDSKIRIRWSAKLWMRDPALGITSLMNGEPALVHVDGVSVYELNKDGLINVHRLENIVLNDQDQPIKLTTLVPAWPGGYSQQPELAIPFFKRLDAALAAQPGADVPAAEGRRERRVTAPVMTAGETPMERAARERAEDEAKRLSKLERAQNARDTQNKGLLGVSAPQQCETSYDCEAPMVCCDLLFASVCCAGGLMIPTTDGRLGGALQRQAIPIPVERDEGANGGYGPTGRPGPGDPF